MYNNVFNVLKTLIHILYMLIIDYSMYYGIPWTKMKIMKIERDLTLINSCSVMKFQEKVLVQS
jgi:hypothetical protein